jgi:iron complex outermembrane recepter protein
MNHKRALLLFTALAAGLPGLVRAADSPATDPNSSAVGEVVVTALKSKISVHETPAAVQVVSQQQLTNKTATDLEHLTNIVPSLEIYIGTLGDPALSLHGLGSKAANVTADQSVGAFYDGVYITHGKGFSSSIYDIDQLEVVKGSEAAVLGKNTSIGALVITTAKPVLNNFEGAITTQYEAVYGSELVDGYINIPVSSDFALRIAGLYSHDAGWVKNTITDQWGPEAYAQSGRLSAFWVPNDSFDATFVVQADHRKVTGDALEPVDSPIQSAFASALGIPGYETKLDYRIEQPEPFGTPLDDVSLQHAVATLNWRFGGGYTLTSVTGWEHYTDQQRSTLIDQLNSDIIRSSLPESDSEVSQELRVVSPSDGRFHWFLGGLYLHDDFTLNLLQNANQAVDQALLGFPFGETLFDFHQRYDDEAAFGHADYDITTQLNLFGALRVTHETKTADIGIFALVPGFYNRDGDTNPFSATKGSYTPFPETAVSRNETDLDGSLGLKYNFDRNVMVYASGGKGTKDGGFTNQPAPSAQYAEYKPEVAWTEEVGAKLNLAEFSSRGYVNVSLFNTDVSNFQASVSTGTVITFASRDLTSRGVDLDSNWNPMKGLNIYWRNVYQNVTDNTAGGTFFNAPRWSGTVGVNYEHSLTGEFSLAGDVSVDYRTEEQSVLSPVPAGHGNELDLPGVAKLNLELALLSSHGWKLAVIGNNVNNQKELNLAVVGLTAPALGSGVVQETVRPRTVTIQLSAKF